MKILLILAAVLGGIALFCLLLCLVDLRICADYAEEKAHAWAQLLFFRYELYPPKPKKPKKPKKTKKPKKQKPKKPDADEKPSEPASEEHVSPGGEETPSPSADEPSEDHTDEKEPKRESKLADFEKLLKLIIKVIKAALPSLKKALSVRIRRLKIICGGEDAAEAALLYGRLCALCGTLCALEAEAGKSFTIDEEMIVDLDYTKIKPEAALSAEIRLNVFHTLCAAVKAGFVYLLNK